LEECREHSDTPTQLEHGSRGVLVGCFAAEAQVAVAGLLLALVCVAILGALRVLQSSSDNTMSAWRLVFLFANAFFCVTLACALYARGR
jgi:hypothetical protein